MKKTNENADKSTAYRTMGLNKISAPNKEKNPPRAVKITGKGDLRGGK